MKNALMQSLALAFALAMTGGAHAAEPPRAPQPAAKTGAVPARPQFTYPTAERTAIELSAAERNYLLNEMRYYLDLLWMVNESLSREDLRTVSIVAKRRAELSAANRLPPELEAKLPSVYRASWRETNRQIDELGTHATTSEATVKSVLGRMATLLQRCNECHTLYQFRADPARP
jgi:hypothetical protein